MRQRSGEEFLDRSAGAGPGGVPDDAGQARVERLAHGGRAQAGRQGAQGALDVAVKVALAVVRDAIERAAGSCGEFRDSPADQAGADRGFVQSGEADEGGGRCPPHQRVCGIQVRGDVLSRGRRSDEAGGEHRGGGGDRVLLVFSKGEETGVGRWWRTRKTRSAGRRSGSADSRHHHRTGRKGPGVRSEQRRTTGALTTGSQASCRPPPVPQLLQLRALVGIRRAGQLLLVPRQELLRPDLRRSRTPSGHVDAGSHVVLVVPGRRSSSQAIQLIGGTVSAVDTALPPVERRELEVDGLSMLVRAGRAGDSLASEARFCQEQRRTTVDRGAEAPLRSVPCRAAARSLPAPRDRLPRCP